MKKTIVFVFYLAMTCLLTNSLFSEDKPETRIGLFGAFNFNNHSLDVKNLALVPCCGSGWTKGDGTGFTLGALFSTPINKTFLLDLRLAYVTRDGLMETDEQKAFGVNGDSVAGTIRHSLDAAISTFGLEAILGIFPFKDFRINLGYRIAFYTQANYDQKERIINPTNVYYPNGSREWLHSSGKIPNISHVEATFLAGVSYDIPLDSDRKWLLSPECWLDLGLLHLIENQNWKITAFRFGLALKYRLFDEFAPSKPLKSRIIPNVAAFGLLDDSVETNIARFRVEEFLSNNVKPLLTYVFFDQASSKIPERYKALSKEQAARFTIDDVHELTTMETYYHVLNIIGRRMIDYPDAKITIEGCTSNEGVEKSNYSLAEDRARQVRNYLEQVWGISPDRMLLSKRLLPQEPSNINEADGIEENRRVEITANKWEIIAPIVTIDTFRQTNPPAIRFKPNIYSECPVTRWAIYAAQDGIILKSINGLGAEPQKVDWRIYLNDETIPEKEGFINYKIVADNECGESGESEWHTLPVEQITIRQKRRDRIKDKYIDRYSLLLFSFDKAEISYYNSLVVDMIKSRMKPESEMKISGHTDRLGDAAYNKRLSKERAEAAAAQFKEYRRKVNGYGEEELIYNNDFPEGRFYCRRVDIVVETPIED